MAFQKGQSGNAAGARIKSVEQRDFEAKCREWCQVYAFEKLKRRLDDDDDKRSDWALEVILNRAFGKPVETSVIEANVTTETGITVEEVEGELTRTLGEPEAEGGGHVGPAPVDAGK